MASEVEGTFIVANRNLYTKTWTTNGPAKAKLIFVHNFNDHVGRYWELFPTLASRGIAVYGFDQRGWGRSVRKPEEKGLSGPMSLVLSDLAAFIKQQLPSSVPVFLMGHSFGSTEILTLASTPEYEDLMTNIRGLLLASPFFEFVPNDQPSWLLLSVFRVVAWLFPSRQYTIDPRHDQTTHDPEVTKSANEDGLLHATGTLRNTMDYLDAAGALNAGTAKLSESVKSVWFAYGTGDINLNWEASRKWWDGQDFEDGEVKVYEGWRYQLHADTPEHRKVFAQDVGDWILARLS